MAKDSHGNELKIGDRVLVECEVRALFDGGYLLVVAIDPRNGSPLSLNHHVLKIESNLVSRGHVVTVVEK